MRVSSGADPGAPLGDPVTYVFKAQGTAHAVYVSATNNHIYELWWDTNGWHLDDLTAATGASAANYDHQVAGYAFDAQYTQHVIYVEKGADPDNGHIHELWWDTNGWHHNDLAAATGAPGIPATSGLAGYACNARYTQHVVYINDALVGHPKHVHELWWDESGWHHTDLTAAGGAPDTNGWGPVGYAFGPEPTRHVIYTYRIPSEAPYQSRICELWCDTRPEVPPLPSPRFHAEDASGRAARR